MIHTLLNRFFLIFSDWINFHFELVKLMNVFKNNGYPENFINNGYKAFLENKHRIHIFFVNNTFISYTRLKLAKN